MRSYIYGLIGERGDLFLDLLQSLAVGASVAHKGVFFVHLHCVGPVVGHHVIVGREEVLYDCVHLFVI